MNEEPSSIINEKLRTDSVNEVVKEKPGIQQNPMEFIKAVGRRFLEKQLQNFPYICEVARVQNKLAWENHRKYGKKGRFTDSYGWSEDGTFKFDYEIPQELYLFMINVVYTNFWSEENEHVWRKFMKRICDGEDPMQALYLAKLKF